MKVSDYIVEYLIEKEITDVFGYPGGMVTHLMDSFSKYSDKISAHLTYHEQGAAFAACGYAQANNKIGIAYATSGPGATNLITGICNAFFDSIPTVFITGQVNTFEATGELKIRQRGFQETDIVSIVKPVTKYAVKVDNADKLKYYLDYAFKISQAGRKGPVLLDIPMNILRMEIEPDNLSGWELDEKIKEEEYPEILQAIQSSQRPLFIIGNGVKNAEAVGELRKLLDKANIPIVTTMLSVDIEPEKSYGFIGAYGSRCANFCVAKSDLVITLGARLDVRQVGAVRNSFAPNAQIIRVDIDENELKYKVHDDEVQIQADVKKVIKYLNKNIEKLDVDVKRWIEVCNQIKRKLKGIDKGISNIFVEKISEYIPEGVAITTDVGQNQVWVAQSLKLKENQKVFFSGGHGAMGYSLPAAIGCALATKNTVYSFSGDGGIQMNIQELQTVYREHLPIKIIVFNNHALGMIRHFQEMYFEDNFYQTISSGGYTVPDFKAIAEAYKLPYRKIECIEEVKEDIFELEGPQFIEIEISEPTYVFPKLEFGKPNQDQEPLLDRELYRELMIL